jgi:hypothetical protein
MLMPEPSIIQQLADTYVRSKAPYTKPITEVYFSFHTRKPCVILCLAIQGPEEGDVCVLHDPAKQTDTLRFHSVDVSQR